MANTRLLPVFLLATFAYQSLSQAIDPFTQYFNDDEFEAESPVFKPKEAEAKVADEIESIPNVVEKTIEEPAEVNEKTFEESAGVDEKPLDETVDSVEKTIKQPTGDVEEVLEELTEVVQTAQENPTKLAEKSIDNVAPHDMKSETIIDELPASAVPKFKEAADKITKTIEEELTKVATSLLKEDSKRSKRDLFDQMTASSNDIGHEFSGNELDVDFDFLENKPVETNTESPTANSMNAQRYYYHTSTPQTTPEYYRYMPTTPEYTAELPQETVAQSANQAPLPETVATTSQAPTTPLYNQGQSYQTPQISATTIQGSAIPQYYESQSYQTPQYYDAPVLASTTHAAVSENAFPFYQQYPQYYTAAATTMHPTAMQGQETLVEEMTDNTESHIVEKEGMPKITHTSRKSTYKVSQSYPHDSTYKQPEQMHYYFMLQK